MRIVMVDRNGKHFEVDTDEIPRDLLDKVIAGTEPVTFQNRPFLFKTWTGKDTMLFVEKVPWMDLHPLVRLDKGLKESR